jgi:hypothetical protein
MIMAVNSTEKIVAAAVHKFAAKRGSKTIFAHGRKVEVHTPGERILHLPNGATVKVWTDESGCATQIEEDDALHAVARPKAIRLHRPIGGR